MKVVRVLTLFLATIVAPVATSTAAPLTLHHQGFLTDNGGAPLNGSFSLTFRLYSVPTGGVALWTETQTVTATDGLFDATLGLTSPISATLFSGPQPALYLGVSVGADGELSPRATLSSAPYALNSAQVDGFSAGPGNVNLGQFSFVGGDSNTVHSDFSSILGGSENTIDITQFADTVFDTTGFSPSARSFGLLHPPGAGTILGGHAITVSGNHSVIVQGWMNDISAAYGFIGSGFRNRILGSYSTIDGGLYNTVTNAPYSVIGGGGKNTANGVVSVIAGGGYNLTTANFKGQVIGGGLGNATNGSLATIGGGSGNRAEGQGSTIGGGEGNFTLTADHQFIGGGQNNRANGAHSTIGGGRDNETGAIATVGGGHFNKAFASTSFIGGGLDNVTNGSTSAIAGGVGNITAGTNSAIGGGDGNNASGDNSTIPGGFRNVASAPNSFAAGTRAIAKDTCSFVWADCCRIPGATTSAPYFSSVSNSFNARATNGFYFLTSCDSLFDPATGVGSGVYVPAGGSMWMTGSSRTLKKNITPVDEDDILERVDQMPVYRWSYKEQGDDVQHIGPMAEDFYETFDIGENERTIGALDPAGVSLAATKALIKENKELKARLARLEKLVSALAEEE